MEAMRQVRDVIAVLWRNSSTSAVLAMVLLLTLAPLLI